MRPSEQTQQFIAKARAVHRDRYDYSLAVYVRTKAKVTIGCPLHGQFEQSPDGHLRGQGCPTCGRLGKRRSLTQAEFLSRAREVHGDRYGYDLVNVTNGKAKVTIVCSVHGPFLQSPNRHLEGRLCIRCAATARARRITTAEFVERAIKRHGSKYDYSRTVLVDAKTKVTIGCEVHGWFEQLPYAHLVNGGCARCGWKTRGEKVQQCVGRRSRPRNTTEQFIDSARRVHGDRYEYSLVSYTKAVEDVTIVCRDHGPFVQTPNTHLNGSGCRRCTDSAGERAIANLLDQAGITYIREWRDHDCGDKRSYKFDFCLPVTKTLIEFDGPHHREHVNWTGRLTEGQMAERLRVVQRRDRVKDEWAAQNGYRMIRLSDATAVEGDLTAHGVLLGHPVARL